MNTVPYEKSYAMRVGDEKTINVRSHPSYLFAELLNLQRLYQEVFIGDIFWDARVIWQWHRDVCDNNAPYIHDTPYWECGSTFSRFARKYTHHPEYTPQAVLVFSLVPSAPDLIRVKRVL